MVIICLVPDICLQYLARKRKKGQIFMSLQIWSPEESHGVLTGLSLFPPQFLYFEE